MQQSHVSRERQDQAQCALRVLSCLLVLLGMLLVHFFRSPQTPSTSLHILPVFDSDNVHIKHSQDKASTTGERFAKGGCMWSGSGWITGLLLTPDGRLVLSNWHAQTLVVKSSATERTIHLQVRPLGMTLLMDSSGRVAVTSGEQEILLVSIDLADHPVRYITTQKRYSAITSGPTENTLIVSSVADGDGSVSIDIITLQGNVTETLIDTSQLTDLRYSYYLANVQGDVFVSALNRNNESVLMHLHQTEQSQWEAVECKDQQISGDLWSTAGHATGDVFISQDDGVLLRTTGGRYLRVLNQTDPYFSPTALAVAQNRLFVLWDHVQVGDFIMVEYHLLWLLPSH